MCKEIQQGHEVRSTVLIRVALTTKERYFETHTLTFQLCRNSLRIDELSVILSSSVEYTRFDHVSFISDVKKMVHLKVEREERFYSPFLTVLSRVESETICIRTRDMEFQQRHEFPRVTNLQTESYIMNVHVKRDGGSRGDRFLNVAHDSSSESNKTRYKSELSSNPSANFSPFSLSISFSVLCIYEQ